MADENESLRAQIANRAEMGRLDAWARDLLRLWAGYPHLNSDPFDSLDMGQRQALIWEYASELTLVLAENGKLKAALTGALDEWGSLLEENYGQRVIGLPIDHVAAQFIRSARARIDKLRELAKP